jgi:hypothetical protein
VVPLDSTYLSSDEPVLLTNHKIIIGGVRHEAALTGKRILIAEEGSGKVIEDIPFAAIGTVTAGENALREPTITLSFLAPAGETRSIEVIFSRQVGGLNIQDRDKTLAFLREHAVKVSGEQKRPADGATPRPSAQEWMPTPHPYKSRQLSLAVPGGRSPYTTIAVVIVIIAVVIGVAFMYDPFGRVKPAVPHAVVPKTTTAPAPVATFTPLATTALPNPPVPPGPAAMPAPTIPPAGVWVRVLYPGNFLGYVSAEGNSIQVNGTGDQVYPLPVRDGMVEGSIEKQDLTGNLLEVQIYQDGALVSLSNITTPGGAVDFHVALPPGRIITGPVITPTPAVAAPEVSFPPMPIPQAGVWVRVYYPGNFTGSVGSVGSLRPVSSTGDQFYQIPISSGTIEGSIEKQDGSVETLVVAIYKDGTLVTRLDTAVPLGVIYLNVPV